MKNVIPTNLKRGFTLIELLVVISIIGLLGGVILASLNEARVKSRDSIRKQDLKTFQIALELYWDSYGAYPNENWCDSSIGSCDAECPCSPEEDNWLSSSGIWTGLVGNDFISALPKDPINRGNYYYWYEPDGVGQGSPPCQSSVCRWTMCARLEKTGGSYCLRSD